jgi:uroporphyrinogen-III decarboxylase
LKFYHLADWPDAFEELHQANRDLCFRHLETLGNAGYDYLFYCVNGTEWISPGFFRQYILEDTREIFRRWRAMGGFILWHSCGRLARLVENGFYNDLKPEILETMSEPPVGDLPSLKWARERLDPGIATKGNVPLNILLLGTEEDVRGQARRIRSETEGYRHIIGLSDDILKGTPEANAKALVDETRKGQ